LQQNFKERRKKAMRYEKPEVQEIGAAEELILGGGKAGDDFMTSTSAPTQV
jgi:hypothetical protein